MGEAVEFVNSGFSLTDLADEFYSDKGSMRRPYHGYTFLYEALFQHLRDRPVSLLELGLARTPEEFRGRAELRSDVNSPSVEMWLRYFPHAHVTGFDLSDFSGQRSERFDFVRGDLGRKDDYQKLAALGRNFDIIVDDGSHASMHQLLAFAELFPLVKDGGFYVIEDIGKQPAQIESANPTSHTVSALFREFLRLGCFPETSPLGSECFNAFLGQINNILFLPYHNDIGERDQLVIIHKKEGSRFHHYRTNVRFYVREPSSEDRESLKRQVRLDAENPYAHLYLAKLKASGGDFKAAAEHLDIAEFLAPDSPQVTLERVRVLFARAEVDQAVGLAVEMMTSSAMADTVVEEIAPELIAKELYLPALDVLEAMLQLSRSSSKGHYFAGQCLEKLGRTEEALNSYRTAYELAPERLMYLRAYAKVGESIRLPGLLEYLEQQRSRFEGRATAFSALAAKVYMTFGEKGAAVENLLVAAADPEKKLWAENFARKHSLELPDTLDSGG